MSELISRIAESVIGANAPISTPFGLKPLVYADYTASGRSLSFIEDYLRDQVMPWYANTHTETSFTGAQTTRLREEAREVIRTAVNGDEDDLVIFCGPGATAAINKMIDILNLRLPRELSDRFQLDGFIPEHARPVVFVGPYEHHSNELPWRESIADVVRVDLAEDGQLDLEDLRSKLTIYQDREMLIGSFSAASNVTGIRTDVNAVTALLKEFNALSFWDYAAAGPYVAINMQDETPIDAAFVSPHKFVGGPGTPGLLLIKRAVLRNKIPSTVGGGTVLYVTPQDHRYIDDLEHREEGGTPAILESVRAGLVFKLQQEVGTDVIEAQETEFVGRAIERLGQHPNIEILGSTEASRLSILSLRMRHEDKDLHYGFVVALLNDLFGIQIRGGCSCAGPYGHTLLNIDLEHSRALERAIRRGAKILRPGWVRLNFNYFIGDAEFDYLLSALELVAEHGWRLLPYYDYEESAGVWLYQNQRMSLRSSLNSWSFADGIASDDTDNQTAPSLAETLTMAEQLLTTPHSGARFCDVRLPEYAEPLRWFTLPNEVLAEFHQPSDQGTTAEGVLDRTG